MPLAARLEVEGSSRTALVESSITTIVDRPFKRVHGRWARIAATRSLAEELAPCLAFRCVVTSRASVYVDCNARTCVDSRGGPGRRAGRDGGTDEACRPDARLLVRRTSPSARRTARLLGGVQPGVGHLRQ